MIGCLTGQRPDQSGIRSSRFRAQPGIRPAARTGAALGRHRPRAAARI